MLTAAFAAFVGSAAAFQAGCAPRTTQKPAISMGMPKATNAALAASLALVIGAADPMMAHAVAPTAVVERTGSLIAASKDAEIADDDLRDSQRKFLEARQKMKQQYDTEGVESNFKSVEEVKDKKNIYITIVTGLIVVAFVAPMIAFFYYTAGE